MLRLVSSALVGQHLKEVEDSVWGLELLPDLLADSTTLGAGLALGEHGSDALLHLGRGEVLGALTHRAIRGPVLDTRAEARAGFHSLLAATAGARAAGGSGAGPRSAGAAVAGASTSAGRRD
jgi:hypothetical protein